jgi:ABC-type antimicrobial peptide transport system permease subunit
VIDPTGRRTEIVGVIRAPLLRASQRRVEPAIYFPMAQDYLPRMTMVIGSREGGDALVTRVRRALEAAPFGEVLQTTTLDAHLSRTALAPERIATVLVGVSAITALAIGILGMYGAMSDAVRNRRREIALRIALGAPGSRIVRQVVAEGVRLATAGAIAGMAGSITIAGWLGRIAPDASAPAIWIWLAAPAALAAVVLVASVIPVGRALAVDPLTIMRAE